MVQKSNKEFRKFLLEYHKNFFVAVFGALAFAFIYDLKGYDLFASPFAFANYLVYLIVFGIIYFLGAIIIYLAIRKLQK